jgi:ATP-binding cassette, subfamily B, bacterial
MMPAPPRKYGVLTLYRRLFWQARGYWFHLLVVIALSLLATPVALLTPVPLKLAIDNVLGGRPLPELFSQLLPGVATSPQRMMYVVAGLVVAVALAGLVQQTLTRMLSTYTSEKLVVDFRAHLFRHVQRLSLAYHDAKGTTDSAYRIQYDAQAIQWLVLEGLVPLATAVATLVSMIVVTARLSLNLALVAMTVAPLFLTLSWLFGGSLRRQWHKAKEIESSALSVVHEALTAVRVVKSFAREDYEQGRFVHHSDKGVSARLQAALNESLFGVLVGLTTAAGTAAVLFIGMREVRGGALSPGNLLLILGYLAQLYGPLKTIGKEVGAKQRSLASAERAFALLDELPEVVEKPHALHLVRAHGRVEFENVCFGYDSRREVLHDVTFDAAAGESVGIQGQTGAGKSTLMNLLLRFYDPTGGRILLDGVDLRDYRLADLRNQFAIVLQEPLLFSTSIAENIAYGRPGASEAEIVEAARAAHAHEFISALPQGYATLAGERGVCLSGGERQRISLARAFLKNAPILILDEPTSAIDLKTEAAVVDAIRHLARGRTTFIIAHRLTTLDHCDALMEIAGGQVVPTTRKARAEVARV